MQSRDNLAEEVPGFPLAQPWSLTDVIIEVAPAGVLHDNHDLAAVLKHWRKRVRMSDLQHCSHLKAVSSIGANQIRPPSRMSALGPGTTGQQIRVREEPQRA